MTQCDIDALIESNKFLQKEVLQQKSTIKHLEAQLAWFRRQTFGTKSERYVPNELQLELDLGIEKQEAVTETETISYTRKKKNYTPHSREKLPDHLPRVKQTIEPDIDTSGMEKLDDKITEKLEIIPAKFYVLQIIRPVYLNVKENGEREIIHAKLPEHCIDKGKAGASMVAQTIVTKCVDHNPLYRFSQQIERDCDMKLPESTLQGWYSRGIFWLTILWNLILEKIVHSSYLQIDETTIQVIIKPKQGKTKKGYMWVYFDPITRIVLFDFHISRSRKSLDKVLGSSFQGVIQTDCYNIYDNYCSRYNIDQAACMSHSRRNYEKSLHNNKKLAHWMMEKIKLLFKIEDKAKENNLSFEQRHTLRQKESLPIILEMKAWCDSKIREVTPKSSIGKAISYMLNHWEKLIYFLKDGRIELSTNWIENIIRPFALGRKNFLFAASEEGARRLAIAYSILSTCKLHGVKPFRYLTDVLEKLPLRKNNEIDDLLPWNWVDTKKMIL